jgi:hypothetical protein
MTRRLVSAILQSCQTDAKVKTASIAGFSHRLAHRMVRYVSHRLLLRHNTGRSATKNPRIGPATAFAGEVRAHFGEKSRPHIKGT